MSARLLRPRVFLFVASCGLAAASLFAGASRAHDYKAGAIQILHPWARATPAGAKVGAGYLEIRNDGAEPDRLVSVTLSAAGGTEIHETQMKDGVMSMRPVEGGLVAPAHGSATLKPGSYHLMFTELKAPLKEGELVDGALTFEKAGTVSVQFRVEGVGAPQSGHMDMPMDMPNGHGDMKH